MTNMDLTPTSKEVWKPALLLAKEGKPQEACALLETKVSTLELLYAHLMKLLRKLTPDMIVGDSV